MFSSGILTPEAMQAFQREVYVMNCLRHPNVVLLMGACQTPPKLAILMEFVAGGSLYRVGCCLQCTTRLVQFFVFFILANQTKSVLNTPLKLRNR